MIEKTYPITQKLLENGLELSLKLLDLLEKEAEQLKQKTEPTKLSSIVEDKKVTVTQLDQFSKQFTQVLATEKLKMSPENIENYFSLVDKANLNASELTSLWQKITEISKKCQLLNQKNGASINILAQYNQRSLHILRGKSQQATTYGPDGSTYNEQGTSNTRTSA